MPPLPPPPPPPPRPERVIALRPRQLAVGALLGWLLLRRRRRGS